MHNLPDPLLFGCMDKVESLSSVKSYVVSAPQTVLWTPPTSVSATCNFGIPYMHALLLSTNTDLPSCTIHLPLHTIPCYPERYDDPLSFSQIIIYGFPPVSTGSVSPLQVDEATYRFTCVTVCSFAQRKLTTLDYSNAASLD